MPTVQPDPPPKASTDGVRGDCEAVVNLPRPIRTAEFRAKQRLAKLTTCAMNRSWPVSHSDRKSVLADAMDIIADKDVSPKDRMTAANVVLAADKVSLAANQQQIEIAKIQIGNPTTVVNVAIKIDKVDAARAYGPILAEVIGLKNADAD